MSPLDQQIPYLKTVFTFVGVTDLDFVVAEPMDAMGAEVQRERLEGAKKRAAVLGERF